MKESLNLCTWTTRSVDPVNAQQLTSMSLRVLVVGWSMNAVRVMSFPQQLLLNVRKGSGVKALYVAGTSVERTSNADYRLTIGTEDRPDGGDSSAPAQLRSRFATAARQVQYPNPTPPLPSRLRWHPKITPFRFAVILVPIIFTTLRAVIIQTGNKTLPITLEWVSGVIIFLMSASFTFKHFQSLLMSLV